MNEKKTMSHFRLLAVLCFGLALLGFNGAILLTPVAGASCKALCPSGNYCSCSGGKCNAEDGVGCTGDDYICECSVS